jgi:predicted nuclease of restriction endonuclease-like (RecB) superfamily
MLDEIKQRIQTERLRVVMSANSAMVLLYWDIGRLILERQKNEGWGAKVIDRLSADLCRAYPDMSGLSPRNLKYMRTFAAAWSDREFVQRLVAQIPWRSNIALPDKLDKPAMRQWYAEKALEQGWSQSVLIFHIESQLYSRQRGTFMTPQFSIFTLLSSCFSLHLTNKYLALINPWG